MVAPHSLRCLYEYFTAVSHTGVETMENARMAPGAKLRVFHCCRLQLLASNEKGAGPPKAESA